MKLAVKSLLVRALDVKGLPVYLAVLAVALALPSAQTGWQMDDLLHRYMLLGYPDASGNRTSPLDLFYFLDGDSTHTQVLMDAGVTPWWTLPSIRLSFWRPLSSLTHWLDYLLWPDNSTLMHLQSLLWFGALVFVVTLLYRRILGPGWIAGLAALFFALDDAHGLAAGWLANRNALIAGLFGAAALLAHDRWRRAAWHPGAFLGPLFLLLGLLAGEMALGACAYLLAYALFIDRAGTRSRFLALLPCAAVALCWLGAYTLLGYGTQGSGFYLDPMTEPLRFLAGAAWKTPLLLTDQWALPPTSVVMFLPAGAVAGLVAWAGVCLVILALLLVPLIRHDRIARFWAAGMLLSLPLVCPTTPHSRLLLFAGIGGFGLLAQWISAVWEKAPWLPSGKLWHAAARVALVLFFIVHIPLAAIMLPLEATSSGFGQRFIQDAAEQVPAGPELASQDLVILNHPIPFYAAYFRSVRLLAGLPAPRRQRILAPGSHPLHVYCPDEHTLILRPEKGYLNEPFDNVFRGPADPMRLGETVQISGMRAQITRMTADGRPAEAAFHFAAHLNDPSLRWLKWEGGRYGEFVLPAVGDSCTLPGAQLFP